MEARESWMPCFFMSIPTIKYLMINYIQYIKASRKYVYNVLCEEQHGFHPNRSCKTQLITTINDFAECLNQGGQCDVLALDFSKAFDKVPHAHLFYKLHHYGVHGALLSWLQAILNNRSQVVALDNQKSHPTAVLSGVP